MERRVRRLMSAAAAVSLAAVVAPSAAEAQGEVEQGEEGPSGEAPSEDAPSFRFDAVADTATLASSVIFAVGLQLVLDTGELRPQEPGDPETLFFIDRPLAKGDRFDDNGLSNVWLGATVAYAVIDTALSAFIDRGDPWYYYVLLYAESAAITLTLTNLTKIAVRRPRPEAYIEFRRTGVADPDTNTALSFFSGHASIAASLSATAIYLTFARESSALERWLVLAGGVLLTGATSVGRVMEGKHFPTDVIAGAVVGGAVGTLVPHLHMVSDGDVGVGPTIDGEQAGLALYGVF